MRTIARATAWLLPLAAAACLTDPAAPIDTGAPTALRVVAQTSPSEGDRTVRVEVYFLSMEEEEVQLPVSPAELSLPASASVTERVTTRLEQCFAEGYTGEAGLYCPLRIHLVLLDDAGEQLAEGFASVDVLPGENPVTVPSISLTPGPGTALGGVVKDATTGGGVAAANVALYAGTNTEATPVATLVAGTGGAYLFPNLTPGTYTVVADLTGYTSTTSEPITVVEGQLTTYDVVLSPQLSEGEFRVVLTWGETPEDLDSYLFGPPSAGSYHVFYASETAPPWANLDVDDTDSFGPETITITQQAEGTHIYAVHNFSDAFTTPDGDPVARMALANSGARVVVYDDVGPIADFTVPSQEGTLWTVFTLNDGVITPVNLMSFVADPDLSPPEGIATSARRDGATLARKAAKRAGAPRP